MDDIDFFKKSGWEDEVKELFLKKHPDISNFTVSKGGKAGDVIIQYGSHSTRIYVVRNKKVVLVSRD